MIKTIDTLESILYNIAENMTTPTIDEDLGVLVLEATLYKYSKDEKYKERALTLLNNAIEVFTSIELSSGFFEGFEGMFWVIHYLKKCNIINDESLLDDLQPYLFQSLENDIKGNFFDALHGSITKLHYLIESENISNEKSEKFVNSFLDSLWENRIENEHGIYWYDIYDRDKGLVNLGLAHGISAVLVFLSRLKKKGYVHPKIDILINGIVKSLFSFKNNGNYSCFPSNFSDQKSNNNFTSRFAWCNGDLGVIYALLYAADVSQDEIMNKQARMATNYLINRRITNSEIDHFEEYYFFDTAFCHGISGIAFTLHKINDFIQHPLLNQRIDYWKKQLLKNLDNQLNIKETIYYPLYKQDAQKTYTLDKCSMLSGLTGTALVLVSFHYEKYDWSDIFLLY